MCDVLQMNFSLFDQVNFMKFNNVSQRQMCELPEIHE